MIVDDNDVPYPRQYLRPHFLALYPVDTQRSGYLVPYAGAPAYWYWWLEDVAYSHTHQKSEAELQNTAAYAARPYPWPHLIAPQLLRS